MSGQAQAGKHQRYTPRCAAKQKAMTYAVPALVAVEDSEADVAVVDCRQRVTDQGATSMVACTHLQYWAATQHCRQLKQKLLSHG